jgi:hypothetical protein
MRKSIDQTGFFRKRKAVAIFGWDEEGELKPPTKRNGENGSIKETTKRVAEGGCQISQPYCTKSKCQSTS